MIDRIKSLLESKEYTKMTTLEMASFLNVPAENHKDLIKAINQLEEEGIVYISKNGYIHLASRLNIYLGEIIVVKKYYAVCKLLSGNEEQEIEISTENLNNAYTKDIVRVQLNNHKSGIVLEIVQRNMWDLVCEYRNRRFISDIKHFPYEIKVLHDKKIHLVDGHIVQLHIKKYEGNVIVCEVMKIIGHHNDPGMDILTEIIKSGVRYEFKEDLLDFCNQLVENKKLDLNKRTDLTDKLIVTIDGLDAKDLDDAISLEILDNGNYYLGVHIADVSYYVESKNPIDKEAFHRGTSIYLADRVIPMLPHLLSNGICSLNEGEIRLTISCFMEIDYAGNVVNYEIMPSYICSKGRLNYQDVNALFNHEETTYPYSEKMKQMLFLMRNLSSLLTTKMVQNGYLELNVDEAKLIMDSEKNKVMAIEKRTQGESEKLIENFMILANETVAGHIFYQQLPFIYRIHAAPKPEKLSHLAASLAELDIDLPVKNKKFSVKELQKVLLECHESENEDVVSNLILRSMSKAIYSVENIGHFGLGSKVYTHFTSPIRRYPDLLVHRYLRKYVFEQQYPDDIEFLIMAAEQSSACERRAVALERTVEDIKKAEYMSDFIGCDYIGMITGVLDFGIFVKLDNTCEGLMRFETIPDFYQYDESYIAKQFQVGKKIAVKLISTHIKNGEINFAYLPKKVIMKNRGGQNKNEKNRYRK